ncbi:hypothetical protein GGI19_000082 [Coemansia pectinata]|uniref:Sucrose transporter n=1 Tax=Coemansia pectinata TaxID=1052879 RepID=A0A9W8LDG6_9FUNG|nr:hypothetical protein GGI19_000082 [Coemansia pectinata]
MASISTKQANTEQTSLLGSSNDGVAEYGLPSAPEHIESERRMLTTWQLSSMTVLLAGIQFVWTVELGYGTPYLLSLGLSKPLMTLVWMAGPLSGLVIQPVVGRVSDKCQSRLGRRRPFIIGGAAFVVASVIVIAYARELATALARMVYPGQSDNVPDEYQAFVSRVSIILAVVGFYVLDFSINTSQACARALALDLPPLKQQDTANAYAGRMLNLGSVSGYLVGFMDLRSLVPWRTDSQMQALCLIATIVFTVTVTWTCVLVREEPLIKHETHDEESTRTRQAEDGEWAGMLRAILRGVMQLPTPVQRVCNVQFFAWVAWFPFLFFATTWVTEIMARTGDITDPEFVDRATRAGSFALFLYAVASLLCSMVLPAFVVDGSERRGISLHRMWRISLVAMGVTLLMTWVVDGVVSATVLIVAMAFPWALAMWAPFALVGEYVAIQAETESVVAVASEDTEEEEEEEYIVSIPADVPPPPPNSVAVIGKRRSVGSVATSASWKRTHEIIGHANAPTESISSTIQDDAVSSVSATSRSALFLKAPAPPPPSQRVCPPPQAESPGAKINDERLESGTILGIHNMYVVFPQFFINGVSSLIFAWLGHHSDGLPRPPGARSVEFLAMSTLMSYVRVNDGGVEPVGFVLRIGGVSALVAAGLTVFLYDRQRVREYIAH